MLKEFQRLFRNFLWKGKGQKQKIVNVSWGKVRRPKNEGGLGLRKRNDWNEAAKRQTILVCGQRSEDNSMWTGLEESI